MNNVRHDGDVMSLKLFEAVKMELRKALLVSDTSDSVRKLTGIG